MKPTEMILFTNLDFVILNNVRTYCHALLLQSAPSILDNNKIEHKVRGFGTEAAWPVFDIAVKSIEHQVSAAVGGPIFIGGEGPARPLFSGSILEMKDGPKITLLDCDHEFAIDVHRFAEGTEFEEIWRVLQVKAAGYWKAPNMPQLNWVPSPKSLARRRQNQGKTSL